MPITGYNGKHVQIIVEKDQLTGANIRARQQVTKLVRRIADLIEDEAKRNVLFHDLYDTGNLLNSIHVYPTYPALYAEIIVGAYYGIYHEFGTVHLPVRAFLSPAIESIAPQFAEELARLMESIFPERGIS